MSFSETPNYYEFLSRLNQDELKRLNPDLAGFGTGDRFLFENHPYQADLDIFGGASLYQLINRCQIEESKQKLARWLSNHANTNEINLRQKAVKELSRDIDWYQDFEADTKIEIIKKQKNHPNISQNDIINWSKRNILLSRPKLWLAISIISNVTVGSLIVAIVFFSLPYHILYAPLVLNRILLGITIKFLNQEVKGIDKSCYLIATYQKAIARIEFKKFNSEKLKGLKEKLTHHHVSAHKSISKLVKLTFRLNSRSNMLYGIFDLLFALDAYLLIDLIHWKKDNSALIENWLGVISEVECLVSLAGFAHQHPAYHFPSLEQSAFHFEAKPPGHPLIPSSRKVRSNFEIKGEGSVDIITGSNMSGKSTFQRTVGINMVLAQMGAPVDALYLSMASTCIFTSMRTKDSLKENTSSFYAELKRIRQLLETIEANESTFFLLDEILKGTNPEDRHNGAASLARKMTTKKTFGLISTHDLTLGQLEVSHKKIRNFSFNSEIKGDEIVFDYKLAQGICKSFNASKLMEKLGIMGWSL